MDDVLQLATGDDVVDRLGLKEVEGLAVFVEFALLYA